MYVHRTGLVLVAFLWLAGCGGGGGGGGGGSSAPGGSGNSPAPARQNVVPITVDSGPSGTANVNMPYVNVTVCVPGNSVSCQTIDHVQVDTASTGLRIVASVLSSSLALPPQTDGSGNDLAECAVFADGYSWGAVRLADVKLAGEMAGSIPVQIIADPTFPTTPASCSNQGPVAENTVQSLGANGILGIGPFVEDCGSACALSIIPGTYYTCPVTGCQSVAVSLARQVQHPVANLAFDNNGVVIELPAVPSSGAATTSGSMILGIGTQSNNGLGNAIIFDLDSSGNLKTLFNSQTLVAFVDSGSNGLFFPDGSIPVCSASTAAPGFYCPATTQALSAIIQGANNGTTGSVNFSVANADALISSAPNFAAFDNLAGPFGVGANFDWGLPFFYGRNVFTAIEQRSTPAGSGPYIAY